jgi:hypothetical protein
VLGQMDEGEVVEAALEPVDGTLPPMDGAAVDDPDAYSSQVERPVRRKWEGRFGASGTGRSEATLEVSSGCCWIG